MRPKWKEYYYSMETEASQSEIEATQQAFFQSFEGNKQEEEKKPEIKKCRHGWIVCNTCGSPWKYSVEPIQVKPIINSPSIWQSFLGIKVPPSKKDKIKAAKEEKLRAYLMMRDLIRRQKEEKAIKLRAQSISQIDNSKFLIKPTSIEDFIFKALLTANASLHINTIITAIEALGWTSSSNKYAKVYKVLVDNDYMFLNIGNLTFKLREGFQCIKPLNIISVKKERKKLPVNHIISLREIVILFIKNIKKGTGVYPGQIYQLMNCSGFSCSYNSIYKIMQGKDFIKDGFSYLLNDTYHTTKKSKSR